MFGDTYREIVVKYIKDNNINVSGKVNYQFGIFTGNTLVFIYEMFRKYNIPVEMIYAFDSFEGLPEEKKGIQRHPNWNKNEFNMKYIFKTDSSNEIIKKIEGMLPDHGIPIQWFEGYFSEVFNHLPSYHFAPSFWVDMDVDLYSSTVDILDFMIPNKLILPDTILSYDDWGGTEEFMGGESMAHKQMCEKYSMKCEEIHSYKNGEHCQKAFIVRSIG